MGIKEKNGLWTIMKTIPFKTSIILLVITLTITAVLAEEKVKSVQIKTADCSTCGMIDTFGQVSLKVCGFYGDCCVTGRLDNDGETDFDRNTVSVFNGDN